MPGLGLLGLCQPQQLPAGLEESLLGTAVGDAGAGIDRRFVAERSCWRGIDWIPERLSITRGAP
jgi:hypothetical protein